MQTNTFEIGDEVLWMGDQWRIENVHAGICFLVTEWWNGPHRAEAHWQDLMPVTLASDDDDDEE